MIDVTEIEALQKRVEILEQKVGELVGGVNGKQQFKKRSSIGEFLKGRREGSARELTLAVCFFIEEHEGLAPFNVKDIEQAYRSAKQPIPGNLNDNVNKNVALGYLMEAKEKRNGLKAWELTATGQSHILERVSQ